MIAMKQLVTLAVAGLVGTSVLRAEPRTFTNTEGKTVEAEPVAMEDTEVLLKLANTRVVRVSLDTLSDSDRAFLKAWWEKNKNKVGEMDVRLKIAKAVERIDSKVTKSGSGGGRNRQASPVTTRTSEDEFKFICELRSYSRKNISDITVDYTIYKRTTGRENDKSGTTTEEIEGTTTVKLLESLKSATFETDSVTCEDFSQSGGTKSRTWRRETVIGVVMTLSAGGEEFLKQSYPENLIERLEEKEERED